MHMKGTVSVSAAPGDWLSLQQASEAIGIGTKTLRRAIKLGQLRASRIDGNNTIRIRRAWIDEWLESCATAQGN
jgi:excisionase family DNA binding protein